MEFFDRTLPKKFREYVTRPHYLKAKDDFRLAFNRLSRFHKQNSQIHPTNESFEDLWIKSVSKVEDWTRTGATNTPFGMYKFEQMQYMMREAQKRNVRSAADTVISNFISEIAEASAILRFEKEYRKVLKPSPGLILELCATEVTPDFSEIQPPFSCVYVQMPEPIPTWGYTLKLSTGEEKTREFVTGFYIMRNTDSQDLFGNVRTDSIHPFHNPWYSANVDNVSLSLAATFCRPDLSDTANHSAYAEMLFGYTSLAGKRGEEILDNDEFRAMSGSAKQQEFSMGMYRLAFNLCLWMSSKEDKPIITRHPLNAQLETDPNPWRHRKFEEKTRTKGAVDEIVLGQHVIVTKEEESIVTKSIHSTGRRMRTHWRRGHWRRVVCGSLETRHHEWRWIKQTLVNEGTSKTPSETTYAMK